MVDEVIDLLRLSGYRKTLIFKAPTGAGKTVMASQMLADLTEELQSRGDSPYQQVAFIWIAPNKLHQQSYFKMKNYFTETRLLKPVMYDEIDQSGGRPPGIRSYASRFRTKRTPRVNSGSTSKLPSMRVAICRQMGRPSPSPFVKSLTSKKGLKMSSRFSSGMASPVFCTRNWNLWGLRFLKLRLM